VSRQQSLPREKLTPEKIELTGIKRNKEATITVAASVVAKSE
jgi:hypothetical protein